ncbi:MAG: FAD-binding oxidoreductase, partial [Chitinophagaceae bacterium]|nr:FAD-binding oxidoreductase [Chitinophagaceae bacterium]
DNNIAYKNNGSYELLNTQNIASLEQLPYLNNLLRNCCEGDAFVAANEKIKPFGFDVNYTKGLIKNTQEGELHTGNMLRSLTDLALSLSIEIKTGALAKRYQEEAHKVIVYIGDTINNFEWPLTCNKLFVCTNAFAQQLLPNQDVKPGRGQILITKPIPQLPFKGIFHFDDGYFYFRVVDSRVLLGGGRNLDFDTETTTDFGNNEKIQTQLEQFLCDIILPNTAFAIAQRWSGIMAFGKNKNPVVEQFSDRVFGAFRMGGMGVALGSLVAHNLVAMVKD